MTKPAPALVLLSPAFAADEQDSRLPSQELLVRHWNQLYPSIQVIVLTFHFPLRRDKEYAWYGNRVISLAGRHKGKADSLLRWTRAWKQLSQLRKQYRVIGIFSLFCSECAFIGHYFAQRHKLQHKIWVLGQDARKDNPQVRRIRPAPDELIVISDFLQREFERNHHIRPEYVIPIGTDDRLFPELPLLRDIDLLGAGSLIPLKQYDRFVTVAAKLAQVRPGLHAVLLGNGPELEALQQVAQRQVAPVVWPGKQDHRHTLAYMQRCKVFLHPSSYEGLGMVCLEALRAGAHVISFCKPLDADIPHWHIVWDTEEMAATALRLLQEEDTAYTTVTVYRMEDTARRLMQLFGISE